MKPNLIQTKVDFRDFLAKAIVKTDEFLKLDASWSILVQVKQQLEFMRQCTDNGRDPLPDEAQKITIGPIAVRNFDDTHPEYAAWLMELDGSFKKWKNLR
ncbi:MAG TPA: immunity protein Tsi6 family protein [Polyangiaceae bacterium]|nr:immunity protein Tsi6 family protein [Polyangiaceae bacterium]